MKTRRRVVGYFINGAVSPDNGAGIRSRVAGISVLNFIRHNTKFLCMPKVARLPFRAAFSQCNKHYWRGDPATKPHRIFTARLMEKVERPTEAGRSTLI